MAWRVDSVVSVLMETVEDLDGHEEETDSVSTAPTEQVVEFSSVGGEQQGEGVLTFGKELTLVPRQYSHKRQTNGMVDEGGNIELEPSTKQIKTPKAVAVVQPYWAL